MWAHPRLRGADSATTTAAPIVGGSSPLTRGGRIQRLKHARTRRLIPAYAGRTSFLLSPSPAEEAHPRLRGADTQKLYTQLRRAGSSPLTRGGRSRRTPPDLPMGLIPAYAGRTGEDGGGGRCDGGSSPLTRGGPDAVAWVCSQVGLIPAYAGRTPIRNTQTDASRAHPRLRGADGRLRDR
ncbi:hypothetical protein HMPREF0308_0801 [Corynebacterium striatum ATCC 6940]|nr:hypothetical protein HMPREF0308_0801 [Corynebacterium striatum ATCC 6940]